MKRFIQSSAICFALLATLLAFSPGQSYAVSITFDPADQDVWLGNKAMVDVVISGLGAYDAPSLGAFDFTIGFDPAILALSNVSFGDPFLGDQLDIWGLGGNPMDTLGLSPGAVNMYEISLDLPAELEMYQADTFVLVSLAFDTLAPGTSDLDLLPGLIPPVFGDAWGESLGYTVEPGSITVVQGGTAPVPEPGTILLLGSGLLGLAGFRRKVSRTA